MTYISDLPATTRSVVTRPSFQVRIGTYTGNGVDNRIITGIGFQPDLVILKGGANVARFRSAAMVGDLAQNFAGTGADTADIIQNFTTDGFVVGTNASANAAGTVYYYVAIRCLNVNYMKVGAYRGNGVDDRSITDLLFQPDFLFLKGNNASANASYRTSLMTGDNTGFFSATVSSSDIIQSFLTNGFQVGASVHANSSGVQYNYWALKTIPGAIKIGQYIGNGADDRNITGIGFQPDIVIAKATASASSSRMRLSNQVGDDTLRLPAFVSANNEIQSLLSDGFQVGTAMNANANLYDYIAIKAGDFFAPITRVAL